ncbi:MAG: energy-coupling factor transporter transmembrane component T [Thermoleophilia bacterium]
MGGGRVRGSLFPLTLGQYVPGVSVVHRADPRLKLAVAFVFAVTLFLSEGWLGLGVLGAGLAGAFLGARLPVRYVIRGLRPLGVLMLFTFLVQAFSFPGEAVLKVGPFGVTREGVAQGGFLTLRLGLLLLSSVVLTASTSPVALTDALEWFLRPLARLRVPAPEIALMVTIALRYIPTLLRELDDLVRAQRARGVDLSLRDPRRLAQALMPLVVPLFVLSFRRADDLAVAMASRCYRGSCGRTRYRELRAATRDGIGLGVAAVWIALALSAGRLWGG